MCLADFPGVAEGKMRWDGGCGGMRCVFCVTTVQQYVLQNHARMDG